MMLHLMNWRLWRYGARRGSARAERARLDDLKAALRRTSYGHVAIIGGVLDVSTASDCANHAAVKALVARGFVPSRICPEPGCDCMVKVLADLVPGSEVAPVKIELTGDDHKITAKP